MIPSARAQQAIQRDVTTTEIAAPLILLLFLFFLALPAEANEEEKKATVRAAHEALPEGSRVDDLGITGPVPVDHPGRRYPATHDFPTGPDIGERLPDFTLPNHNGEAVDYHADRGDSKSVVVFFRSAVW